MPIVIQGGGAGGSVAATTTVQAILNCTSQDVRGVLNPNSGATAAVDSAILIDYTNRICNELLRFSRWRFLQSPTQVFLTTPGITDYYIGQSPAPVGCVDTNLEITDLFTIKRGEFIDRTQQRRLGYTDEPPVGQRFSQPAKPALFRNDPQTPNVINIYPPPNQNTFQFVPKAAITTAAAGGALPFRTYYITLTFGDDCGGQSAQSIEQIVKVPANKLLTVRSPVLPLTTDATTLLTPTGPTIQYWNVYISQASSGSERLQLGNILLGTDWTESSSGVTTSGVGPPTQNTLAVLGGYIMEFEYFQNRKTLTNISQVIQIPDTYKDIVCAGVNWLAFKYLEMDENAQLWKSVFEAGKTQIVKDANLMPRGEEFIRPDAASVTYTSTGNLGLDSGIESSLP